MMFSKKSPKTFSPFLLSALIAGGTAFSCGVGWASDAVSMTYNDQDGCYDIIGRFQVDAGPDVIWDVLTGYDRIPRFVGSLKISRVEKDLGPYHYLLEQEFEGGFLFIIQKARVDLDVHEVWYKSIDFADIDHKDFAIYEGSWELAPDPAAGEDLTYHLKAKPNFSVPFAGDFMHGGAKDLLEAVRKEIIRMELVKLKENQSQPSPPLQAVTAAGLEVPLDKTKVASKQ